jgi:hypothetical protein
MYLKLKYEILFYKVTNINVKYFRPLRKTL